MIRNVNFAGLLLLSLFLLQACASSSNTPLLNSERIEKQFGSYGVEVFCADNSTRVSNLYSLDAAERISRTIALVEFVDLDSSLLQTEHQTIVAGGSIGYTLKSAGWVVSKHSHQVGELESTSLWLSVAPYMKLDEPVPLAFDRYLLAVSRNSTSIDYALITEIYHPEYLNLNALLEIVKPAEIVSQDQVLGGGLLELITGCLGG